MCLGASVACAFGPAATPTPETPPTPTPLSLSAIQTALQALPAGDPERGQQVFTAAGCVACHAVVSDVKIVGPSLQGVVTQVGTLRPGYTAEEYLYESIVAPNAYVVADFQPDIMPKVFLDTLPPQDLADIIAYLMTLK
jgi:mono/diheme cytochrome c family protein